MEWKWKWKWPPISPVSEMEMETAVEMGVETASLHSLLTRSSARRAVDMSLRAIDRYKKYEM